MHETGTAERDGQSPTSVAPSPSTSFVADSASGLPLHPNAPRVHPHRRRIQSALAALVILGLAAILPPLVNVNRYQRRIAFSISQSLGRPVHMDAVTMNLLPVPGFTLSNFVISEDPAFGSEPVVRAASVRANLRLRSLWHRRVEFSRINLAEPSVNLVHRADGRWNIESILLSASRIPVVPTDQPNAAPGGIQRFPYIEATGARVNIKEGLEKKPISLNDADFALWLPQPQLYRLRLTGHPTRTDTAAADSGILRVAGTLGKAASLEDVPIVLQADWTSAPLGAASNLFLGRDAGFRGDLTLRLTATGTLKESSSSAHLELRNLRRADFVPAQTLDLDLGCNAKARAFFHRLDELQCASMSPDGGGIAVDGEVPDLFNWHSAVMEGKWQSVPASLLLRILHVASPRDAELEVGGTSDGHVSCCASILAGVTFSRIRVALPSSEPEPRALLAQPSGPVGDLASGVFTLSPVPLDLGAPQPAILTLQADSSSLRLHLTGTALRSHLLALAAALPIFGEGLPEALPASPTPSPIPVSTRPLATAVAQPAVPAPKATEPSLHLDLLASRPWGSSQTWTPLTPPVAHSLSRRSPHRKHPAPSVL